jgi:hypothetical protein
MTSALTDIAQKAKSLCLVRSVDMLPKGHARIQTMLMYPDRSYIDVFVYADPDQPLLPPTVLSDLGQTTEFLLNHHVRPWTSKKRRQQLEDAVAVYGAKINGGKIELAVDGGALQDRIILLAQACLRASDLVLTKRLGLQSDFADDVEAFLSDQELDFDTAGSLPGLYGPVSVDFVVRGAHTTSAVFSLSSRTAGSGHTSAVEVFRKAHDLAKASGPEERVTIVDDSVRVLDVFKQDDLNRIEEYARVFMFSDRAQAHALMAA